MYSEYQRTVIGDCEGCGGVVFYDQDNNQILFPECSQVDCPGMFSPDDLPDWIKGQIK